MFIIHMTSANYTVLAKVTGYVHGNIIVIVDRGHKGVGEGTSSYVQPTGPEC